MTLKLANITVVQSNQSTEIFAENTSDLINQCDNEQFLQIKETSEFYLANNNCLFLAD